MKKLNYTEWIKRYSLPEINGLIGAYLAILVHHQIQEDPNNLISSFLGTWGENIGYYSTIIYRDVAAIRQKHPSEQSTQHILRVTRGLFIEFGFSEFLDSFIIRPACLFYGMLICGDSLGILVGKFSADIFFYILTITCYELKKKHNL